MLRLMSFVFMSLTADSTSSSFRAVGGGDFTVSLRHHVGRDVRLVLASQSPRRREILDMMGLRDRYVVVPSPLDEAAAQAALAGTDPQEYTLALAREKARALAEHVVALLDVDAPLAPSTTVEDDVLLDLVHDSPSKPIIVLGSDTIVEMDAHVLEKPRDVDDAKRMLQALSGRRHKVHTGVALYGIVPSSKAVVALHSCFVDSATVEFAELPEADVDAYIATGEPLDKAGSYGIQGIGGQFVRRMEGDFFTVMGLPMHRLSRELAATIRSVIDDEQSEQNAAKS